MKQLELHKLLAFYQRALDEQSIDNIQRSVDLLEKHLPHVDQEASDNIDVLAKLKQVHFAAMSFIKTERDTVKVEMESMSSNKARDFAYQKTQLSQ